MEKVSIVVITLNEAERIGRLLEDLSNQTHQGFEVILVDSQSEDDTCEIALGYQSQLPELTVHEMDARGVSLGRNTGAKLAKYERLLFLDADVRLSPDFLSRALHKLDHTKLEVAGVYMGANGLPLMHKLGYGLFNLGLFATQYAFPTAVGACIFSTKTVHERISGFDENITLCEDCDYVNRASKTWRYRLLPITFEFDSRRLDQDGMVRTGLTYLRANLRRLFIGEMRNQEIRYPFGHYNNQA